MYPHLPRILQLLAALSLLTLFVFPMWQITLEAPQYPGGVTMHIWINKIGGETPGTLQNINILNHYVGMKKIVPESIPELRYFPLVIMAMVALGVVVALVNRRWAMVGWTAMLALLCVLGMYDFYLWEYDYGHNLDPTAPIKVEGMAYQPPLIGRKALLNFVAISLPHVGGYFVGLALVLGMAAIWLKTKILRHAHPA